MPFINLEIYSTAQRLKCSHTQRLLQHALNPFSGRDRCAQGERILLCNFGAWNLSRELLESKAITQFHVRHLGRKKR